MRHVSKAFVTAGKATFTIELPPGVGDKPHYTYRVTRKEASLQFPETYFVALLSGPDNTSDYTYLGILIPSNGEVRTTRKSTYNAESFPVRLLSRVLARIWADDHNAYEQHGFQTHHVGKCGRCGRDLTVPSSVESGFGPECATKI